MICIFCVSLSRTSLSPAWAAKCPLVVPICQAALLLHANAKSTVNVTQELPEPQEEKGSAVTEMGNSRSLKAAVGNGGLPQCGLCKEVWKFC